MSYIIDNTVYTFEQICDYYRTYLTDFEDGYPYFDFRGDETGVLHEMMVFLMRLDIEFYEHFRSEDSGVVIWACDEPRICLGHIRYELSNGEPNPDFGDDRYDPMDLFMDSGYWQDEYPEWYGVEGVESNEQDLLDFYYQHNHHNIDDVDAEEVAENLMRCRY